MDAGGVNFGAMQDTPKKKLKLKLTKQKTKKVKSKKSFTNG